MLWVGGPVSFTAVVRKIPASFSVVVGSWPLGLLVDFPPFCSSVGVWLTLAAGRRSCTLKRRLTFRTKTYPTTHGDLHPRNRRACPGENPTCLVRVFQGCEVGFAPPWG